MAVITEKVRERFGVPLGINVLANAAIPAMAIATAGGADFVRVNQWANAYIANEGFIEGAAAKARAIAVCCVLSIFASLPIATLSTVAMLSLPIVRFRS